MQLMQSVSVTNPRVASHHRVYEVPEKIISSLPAGHQRFQSLVIKFVNRLKEKIQAMEKAVCIGDYSELEAEGFSSRISKSIPSIDLNC